MADLTMFTTDEWKMLITRRNRWVAYNFPNQDAPDDSILGVIEETGELVHGYLKAKQHVRVTEDHDATIRDAVGDITVYLLGVLDWYDVVPDPRGPKAHPAGPYDPLWLGRAVGCLCEARLDRITVNHEVNVIVEQLWWLCLVRGWSYRDIVMAVWDEVEERDWIKYPEKGRPSVAVEEASPDKDDDRPADADAIVIHGGVTYLLDFKAGNVRPFDGPTAHFV